MRSLYGRLSGTLKQKRQYEKYHPWYKRTILPTPVLVALKIVLKLEEKSTEKQKLFIMHDLYVTRRRSDPRQLFV